MLLVLLIVYPIRCFCFARLSKIALGGLGYGIGIQVVKFKLMQKMLDKLIFFSVYIFLNTQTLPPPAACIQWIFYCCFKCLLNLNLVLTKKYTDIIERHEMNLYMKPVFKLSDFIMEWNTNNEINYRHAGLPYCYLKGTRGGFGYS